MSLPAWVVTCESGRVFIVYAASLGLARARWQTGGVGDEIGVSIEPQHFVDVEITIDNRKAPGA